MAQCPVDHSSSSSSTSGKSSPTLAAGADKCPVDHSSGEGDKCPVEPSARSIWSGFYSSSTKSTTETETETGTPPALPTAREVSSIPRSDGERWVYPSEAQFFAAMERKKHAPRADDMRVVVPIHNAVNERAWGEVRRWEEGWGGEGCGGVRLVSFKGRPGDRTPRAWVRMLLGYQGPFDRHDWVVDRCGRRMRYVIDFYAGKAPMAGNLAFFLDVRPALDNWEGVKMRAVRFVEKWVGGVPWMKTPSGTR